MQTGLGAKRGHNEECRARMETALGIDKIDRTIIEAQKSELDAYASAKGSLSLKESGLAAAIRVLKKLKIP